MESRNSTMIVHPCDRLAGEIILQGSKNSVLPIMAAAVLNRGISIIDNCPEIADVYTMISLLRECGCHVIFENHVMIIDGETANTGVFVSSQSTNLRASILLMGSCLGRFGEYRMPYPGGCAIGSRPVNFHVDAMIRMGAEVEENEQSVSGKVTANEPGRIGLRGCTITLPFPSVGATQNVLIAAMSATGNTEIIGASLEPEIWDLCDFLRKMGAVITGDRIGHIVISPPSTPVKKDIYYELPADRIVAGTILTACAGTTGNVYIPNVFCDRLSVICRLLGARGDSSGKGIVLNLDRRPRMDRVITTGPFPEFPTDMQSIFLALMSVTGTFGIMEESIFETRFLTAYELNKLGADIRVEGRYAYVYGRGRLHGGTVNATDLRGGAALVLAGLFADSDVVVGQCGHIYRGYERLAENLSCLGAKVESR